MENAPQASDQEPAAGKRLLRSYSIALWLMYWWVYLTFFPCVIEFTLAQTFWLYLPFIVVMLPFQACLWSFARAVRERGAANDPDAPKFVTQFSFGALFAAYVATAALMLVGAMFQHSYFHETFSFYPGDPEGMWPVGLIPSTLWYVVILPVAAAVRAFIRGFQAYRNSR